MRRFATVLLVASLVGGCAEASGPELDPRVRCDAPVPPEATGLRLHVLIYHFWQNNYTPDAGIVIAQETKGGLGSDWVERTRSTTDATGCLVFPSYGPGPYRFRVTGDPCMVGKLKVAWDGVGFRDETLRGDHACE